MAPFNKTSRGLPQVVLVITLVWALSAVLIFTGILINAREIDRRVLYINSQLVPIEKHTSYIALAGKTKVLTDKILAAVPTLAPGLTKVGGLVTSIDKTAKTILATAKEINTKVLGIGATVTTIHGTVTSIHNSVTAIHSDVVGSITPKLATTGKAVAEIHSSVNSILAAAKSILGTARDGIQPAVTDINSKAVTVLGSVDAGPSSATILPLTVSIDNLVGRTDGTSPTTAGNSVLGHANSIDCSGVINLGGATKFCGKGIR